MSTEELIHKIKAKLSEWDRVFGNKSKPIEHATTNESRLSNPFEVLGKKRPRPSNEENNWKFVFKHKEGFINAVKRNVPFEFFI